MWQPWLVKPGPVGGRYDLKCDAKQRLTAFNVSIRSPTACTGHPMTYWWYHMVSHGLGPSRGASVARDPISLGLPVTYPVLGASKTTFPAVNTATRTPHRPQRPHHPPRRLTPPWGSPVGARCPSGYVYFRHTCVPSWLACSTG
jgi:hypothetical protein